jgi:hypothetical protein
MGSIEGLESLSALRRLAWVNGNEAGVYFVKAGGRKSE